MLKKHLSTAAVIGALAVMPVFAQEAPKTLGYVGIQGTKKTLETVGALINASDSEFDKGSLLVIAGALLEDIKLEGLGAKDGMVVFALESGNPAFFAEVQAAKMDAYVKKAKASGLEASVVEGLLVVVSDKAEAEAEAELAEEEVAEESADEGGYDGGDEE